MKRLGTGRGQVELVAPMSMITQQLPTDQPTDIIYKFRLKFSAPSSRL